MEHITVRRGAGWIRETNTNMWDIFWKKDDEGNTISFLPDIYSYELHELVILARLQRLAWDEIVLLYTSGVITITEYTLCYMLYYSRNLIPIV